MNHLASFTATHWLHEHQLGIRIAEYQRILQMLEGHTTPAAHTLRKQLVGVIEELELVHVDARREIDHLVEVVSTRFDH